MGNYFKELVTVYSTTSLIRVRSPLIAVLNIVLIILVWCSFLGSLNLDVRKVYQSTCPVQGVVLSKVKGFASTERLSNEDLAVDQPELYKRIWDQADIVLPVHGGEGESGSFTVVTNLVITPNQTQRTCAEAKAKCNNDSDCQAGFWSASTHGVFTGKCLNATCEIKGWCPTERRVLPLKGKRALLEDVKNFSVMLKNSVEFPGCGPAYKGRNLPSNLTLKYLKNCTFHRERDPLCPIFRIGDIVEWSGENFSSVAIMGGCFGIKISWNCDFDFGKTVQDCLPTYEFLRVNDSEAGEAKGWNFRSANFFENKRTLKKQFALKMLISVEGEGKKFSLFQLVITCGSTIGLFSVAPLVCDFLLDVFNLLSRKCKHCSKFHDNTSHNEDDVAATSLDISKLSQGISNQALSKSTMSINNGSFKHLQDFKE